MYSYIGQRRECKYFAYALSETIFWNLKFTQSCTRIRSNWWKLEIICPGFCLSMHPRFFTTTSNEKIFFVPLRELSFAMWGGWRKVGGVIIWNSAAKAAEGGHNLIWKNKNPYNASWKFMPIFPFDFTKIQPFRGEIKLNLPKFAPAAGFFGI